jgi:hypothetical protein
MGQVMRIEHSRIARAALVLCRDGLAANDLNAEEDQGQLALNGRKRVAATAAAAGGHAGGKQGGRLERAAELERSACNGRHGGRVQRLETVRAARAATETCGG